MGPEVSESVLGTLDNLLNVHLITSYYRFDLIKKDRDDNKFVDCAIAANANYIISEDKDFRILKRIEFPKVVVLDLKKFEKILEKRILPN